MRAFGRKGRDLKNVGKVTSRNRMLSVMGELRESCAPHSRLSPLGSVSKEMKNKEEQV